MAAVHNFSDWVPEDWMPANMTLFQSPSSYQIAGAFLTLIAVFGIFNNMCVIVLIIKERTLRTPINFMLLNLSTSDLVLAAYGSPLTAAAAFRYGWYFGRPLCLAESFGMAICGIASISSLAVISVERYLLVTRPGIFSMTRTHAISAIVAVWIYSFIVNLPPLIGWGSYTVASPAITCDIDWQTSGTNNFSYIAFLFFFGLILPLAAITFSYWKIFTTIRKQSRAAAGGGVAKSQVRIIVMVLIMIAAFLVAWMPYSVLSLVVMFGYGHLLSASALAAPVILAKSSIVYNPIIYVLLNKQFRDAFVLLATCNNKAIWRILCCLCGGGKVAPIEPRTGNATFRKTNDSESIRQLPSTTDSGVTGPSRKPSIRPATPINAAVLRSEESNTASNQ